MYLSLFPGVNPICIHSQLLFCLKLIDVTNALTLFWLCNCFSNLCISSFLLLVVFCRFKCTSLSSFVGVNASPVCCAILSSVSFIFDVAFALEIIVVVRSSGILHPFQWCIQVVLVHIGRCKIFFTYLWISQFSFLASSKPSSLNLSWYFIFATVTCLITSTFCMGFRWAFHKFSRYLFHSALGSLTVPSGCILFFKEKYMYKHLSLLSRSPMFSMCFVLFLIDSV